VDHLTLRWTAAAAHLLALIIGAASIAVRASTLRRMTDARLPVLFRADSWWGLSALLFIATGLWRAFGGLEKGSAYYLGSTAFQLKMGLLLAILLLELHPMTTLIRWRIARARGQAIDLGPATTMARISTAQLVLLVAMMLAATAMARGLFI
jgi:putative membrane protein